jgi:branched-chain amino acid transport system ATP-binding protein
MNILEVKGLRKKFGELVAVENVDLSVKKGEILGLIGPNGSGKSTMFGLITGFLKPTAGKIIWQGENITGLPPHVIAEKGITRTFQLTALYQDMTVLKNILIACHLHVGRGLASQFMRLSKMRAREKEIEEMALELMNFTGLTPHKDKLAGELSSGFQKALAISIGYTTNPKLLLLDEPATTLSEDRVKMVMELVTKLRNAGTTIVLIEHNFKAITDYCDRIVALGYGRKIAEGTAEEVRENKEVVESYLGVMDNAS